MNTKSVFISYRREDAAGFPQIIRDRLTEHLPTDHVFCDVTNIDPGENFVEKLNSTLDRCKVMIVLIGKRWVGGNPGESIRIQDPKDWVRTEVAAALHRQIQVIPVLIDGASMPPVDTLPEELRPLAKINCFDLRSSRITTDVWDLVGTTVRSLGGIWPPPEPGGKIYALLAGAYAFLVGAFILLALVASMFTELELLVIAGIAVFVLNAALLLRLPIHHFVRSLSRSRALKCGAALHLVAFSFMAMSEGDTDGVVTFVFGLFPSALLFFASYAMRNPASRL